MKSLVFNILHSAGVNRVFSTFNRNRPIILAFHGVTNSPLSTEIFNHQGKHLRQTRFLKFMRLLNKGFRVVSLRSLVECVEQARPFPRNAVAITFDDGYKNNSTVALPILESLGMTATFFVVTDFVFGRKMLWTDRLASAIGLTKREELTLKLGAEAMTLDLSSHAVRAAADRLLSSYCKTLSESAREEFLGELFELAGINEEDISRAWAEHEPMTPKDLSGLIERGFEIGSHGMSHTIATRMSSGRLEEELRISREVLADHTGRPCTSFSYPNGAVGDFDARTGELVRRAGFSCALTTVKRRLVHGMNNFELPRHILADNRTSSGAFATGVSGLGEALSSLKRRLHH